MATSGLHWMDKLRMGKLQAHEPNVRSSVSRVDRLFQLSRQRDLAPWLRHGPKFDGSYIKHFMVKSSPSKSVISVKIYETLRSPCATRPSFSSLSSLKLPKESFACDFDVVSARPPGHISLLSSSTRLVFFFISNWLSVLKGCSYGR